jgi:hypothetical protein
MNNAIIDNQKENPITKIEVDLKKLWSWFEREIGLEHPAAKSLNVIAPKPTPVSPVGESSTSAAPASGSGVSSGTADTVTI